MGLFSKKPKSIVVQQPGSRPGSDADPMDRLEALLPKVEDLPKSATRDKAANIEPTSRPPKPSKPAKRNRKTGIDPADFLALRSELVDMRARLDDSERARARVEDRLGSLDATAAAFSTERNDISELKIAEFEAQIAQLRAELDKATTAASEAPPLPPPLLSGPDSETLAKVDGLAAQLEEIGERLRVSDELRGQVGQLAERVTVNDAEARAVREHMAVLDQRLTNVSTELANQLSELGSDIDGLGQRMPERADSAVSDEVVDALRGGQVKLANEQARYEIAFRQDLATLAEQLRQGRDDASEGEAG